MNKRRTSPPVTSNVQDFFFKEGSTYSTTQLLSEGMLVVGWLYTAVVSLLLVWPAAHYLRQLPVLKDML